MASTYKGGRTQNRFPGPDAEDQVLLDYNKRFFSDYNAYRCKTLERMALNHHYYLGRQWIELDSATLVAGSRGFVFKDMLPPLGQHQIPKPVTNKVDKAVELELASLTKRQLVPKVIPDSRDPRVEAAARIGGDILAHRLADLSWPDKRSISALHLVLYGTTFLKSYWDYSWSDTSPTPSQDAVQCECGLALNSPYVSPEEVAGGGVKHLDTATPLDGGGYSLRDCPRCDEEAPLQPLALDEASAAGDDTMGRPMSMNVPRGDTALDVVSPFEMFLENNGVGRDPFSLKAYGQATIRPLEWIEDRFQSAEVDPEDPVELMKYHPILGDWELVGRWTAGFDTNIYDCHARVYELHVESCGAYPDGYSLIATDDKILWRGPLYKTIGQARVPMVVYGASRWKVRPDEFYGKSLVDDLISLQNRLNGIDSQITEARERLGAPNIMTTKHMELEGPEWDEAGGGAIWRYDIDPLSPNAKPDYFGDKLFDTNVFQERDRIDQDIKEQVGPQDIEIGEAPKNVTTTGGLQLLGEAAERRRSERERGLSDMYEYVWSHQLQLLGTLRVEKDTYEKEAEDGTWEIQEFDKESLKGQTKVKVEKQAYVDKSYQQIEATREAMADGLYDISTPSARRRILELRNLPTDVNEQQNYQLDLAKKKWVDFVDKAGIPVIDTSLDDYAIHWDTLGAYLVSPEGQRIATAIGWNGILKGIAGWEQQLAPLEAMDMASRQAYGPDPAQAKEKYAQAYVAYSEAKSQEEQMQQAAAAAMAPAPPSMLQPPPQPFYLPPDKADRIYQLWVQMLEKQGGVEVPQGVDEQKMDLFLKFRAVVDGYRLLAQEKAMQSMMGPTASAPGVTAPGQPQMKQPVVPEPPNPQNSAPVPIV